MRKNFDMDAAIRRALRESIEAHAHEWEPKFNTGVGPVGDDAPFDKKVSGDVNEGKDCEDCCPKCGKCPCECDKVNEGTIPGDSHEWEPGFETGVGEVGDDSPFTQAVNEAFVEGGDWEKNSFCAPNHKKEGISFADGGDECQNGVVATSQKNSGEVVSSDNLSEGEDEEGEDEGFLRNVWQGAKAAVKPAVDRFRNAYKDGKAQDQAMKDAQAYAGNRGNYEKNAEGKWQLKQQNTPSVPASPAAGTQDGQQNPQQDTQDSPVINDLKGTIKGLSDRLTKVEQTVTSMQQQKNTSSAAEKTQNPGSVDQNYAQDTSAADENVVKEERDRFFNIINRIEKLYD